MVGKRLRATVISLVAVLALGLVFVLGLPVSDASATHSQCAGAEQQCQPLASQKAQAGMNATASTVGENRVVVAVENAGYGRSASVGVPFEVGDPGGEGELRGLRVDSGNRTGEYTIAFDVADSAANLSSSTTGTLSPVPGVEDRMVYVAPDSDLPEDAFSLTYRFDVDRGYLQYHDVSGDDAAIAVYRDGEWQQLQNTEVKRDGSEVVVSASVSTTDPVALGLYRGNLSVVGVGADGVLVSNRTSEITVQARNDGSRAATETVAIEGRNDWIVTRDNVTVPANSERTARIPVQFNRSGTWPLEVGDQETTVRVLEPQANASATNLTVRDSRIEAGEEVQLVATVRNTGRANGTTAVPFRAFGDVVGTTEVTLARGETETVQFSQRIDAPGTHRVGIANKTTTVQVEGETPATEGDIETTPSTSQAVTFWGEGLGSWAVAVGIGLALLFGAVTVSRLFGRD